MRIGGDSPRREAARDELSIEDRVQALERSVHELWQMVARLSVMLCGPAPAVSTAHRAADPEGSDGDG